MATLSGSGPSAQTEVFTAGFPGWYDFRTWLSSYSANGSAGLVLHLLVNGVEVGSGSNPLYNYLPGQLPFGVTTGIFNTITAFGASEYRGGYALVRLEPGDVVSVQVGTKDAAEQPDWSFEFTGQRFNNEI